MNGTAYWMPRLRGMTVMFSDNLSLAAVAIFATHHMMNIIQKV
jgi:hypothetical protein